MESEDKRHMCVCRKHLPLPKFKGAYTRRSCQNGSCLQSSGWEERFLHLFVQRRSQPIPRLFYTVAQWHQKYWHLLVLKLNHLCLLDYSTGNTCFSHTHPVTPYVLSEFHLVNAFDVLSTSQCWALQVNFTATSCVGDTVMGSSCSHIPARVCSNWIPAWFYWSQLSEPDLSINTHYNHQGCLMVTITEKWQNYIVKLQVEVVMNWF